MAYSKETIGGNIRAERARMRMSRATLADKSGIPPATIQSYEDGVSGLNIENAWKLADCFDMTLDALVGRSFEKAS